MDTLVLIDGNSLLNRAYFALPPLNNSEGVNVNAVYGFMNILIKALTDCNATHVAVAFDLRGKNFRKEIYPEYKANRKGMPDDLAAQMPYIHELLTALNIRIVEKAGVEADDIIGTLSKRFRVKTYIVTGDRDLLQLVDNESVVILTKRGVSDIEENNMETIKYNYNLTPMQIIEYKAICGDSSDNIPGVAGIGDKGAMNLLAAYGDLDGVYSHLSEIKGALQTKLIANKEQAYMSKKLATIITDCDIECQLDECNLKQIFPLKAKEILQKLEFNTLIKRMRFDDGEYEKLNQFIETESIINDDETLNKAVNETLNQKEIAIFIGDYIAFAYNSSHQYKIELSNDFISGYTMEKALLAIKPILVCPNKKIVYDGKRLKHILYYYGYCIENIAFDVSIMDYLASYRTVPNLSAFFDKYKKEKYATGLYAIAQQLKLELKKTETEQLYESVELPLSNVLFDMENEGFKVDKDVLEELSNRYTTEIKELNEQAFEAAGERFNLMSPKQLGVILFEKLHLPQGRKTKTGYSTDIDVMTKLMDSHPIVPIIMKVRTLSKLNGTYIEGMRQFIDNSSIIHTTFNQTLTVTGRLSSSEPNLQNLPVRNELGKEIRKMFIPKYDVLVGADYSQIELRLLAHFSEDKNLIDSFNAGKDIHSAVAAELFGVPQEMVTSNMRRTAKAVNFGIIYGISDYGLSQNTGLTPSKAKSYINKYFEKYPTIKTYLDGSIEFARNNGYILTVTNRRRLLPEINSSNYQLRSFAQRAAMNMPLQGSAADIMKIAMIRVYNALKKEKLKSKLILQIHDELIVDTFNDEEERVKNILKYEMENALEIKVKMSVNLEVGLNLYEAK
ncbi:MAG: DNA polymerase I [Clostridia bacterium]